MRDGSTTDGAAAGTPSRPGGSAEPGGAGHVATGEAAVRPFEDVTAVEALDDGGFAVVVDDRWGIAGRPNGGALLATIGRAATAVATHDHVLAASAHFVRSPEPGPATVATEVMRSGRSVDQVRCRLVQDGEVCVEALVAVGRVTARSEPYWAGGVPEVTPTDPDDAVRILGPTPTGMDVPLLRQVDLRLDPSSLGFAEGAPTGRGELSGWLALADGAAFDPISLLTSASPSTRRSRACAYAYRTRRSRRTSRE
jgi:hypothetical protein